MNGGQSCSHGTINYKPIKNDDGSYTHRWICKWCGTKFGPTIAIEDTAELDEVRAEIIKERDFLENADGSHDKGVMCGLNIALDIIDKHFI